MAAKIIRLRRRTRQQKVRTDNWSELLASIDASTLSPERASETNSRMDFLNTMYSKQTRGESDA